MAWTATTFKERYPTFLPKADALVVAVLAEAAAEVDARLFGATTDTAVGLLAAHKLSVDPSGAAARTDAKTILAMKGQPHASSTYGIEFDALVRKKAGGPWTIGQGPRGYLP